jgi:hypothetical protein
VPSRPLKSSRVDRYSRETLEPAVLRSLIRSGVDAMSKPPMIDDKAIAVVDGEWRSAREIYAILDEGAFVSTAAALVRLADAGRIERRHDLYRNVKVMRYRSQNQTQRAD